MKNKILIILFATTTAASISACSIGRNTTNTSAEEEITIINVDENGTTDGEETYETTITNTTETETETETEYSETNPDETLDSYETSDIVTNSTSSSEEETIISDYNSIDSIDFESATVVRIVDGDTIVVDLDDDDSDEDYKVRLIGVDTPESVASQEYLDKTGKENTEAGTEASNETKSLVDVGSTVYLEKDTSDVDKYDRLLRYVWLVLPDEISTETIATDMLNGILLTDQTAQPESIAPDTMYADEFETIYNNY